MIFITGCARSGTSLVAGITVRCGAYGGDVFGPNRWNPHGQYENKELRNNIIKPMLKIINADPMGQNPLPDMSKISKMLNGFPAETKSNIDSIMHRQGSHDNWFFKEPKLCLLWPIIMRAYPEAHYIIARRPDELIIQSCIRTSFMKKRTTVDEWQEWIDYHKELFMEMAVYSPDNVHVVSTLDIVKGEYDSIRMIIEKVGLKWNQKAVESFVDKKIWNTVK